ncbi:hypothetical protein FRC12_019701 [Ceratobasidium sp. 428]|nr:hypothetical protein FRC12_019701 [Ceratobasidium sp. 428]
MVELPRLKLINRSAFPSKIRMPDIVSYTGKVFQTKINPHWVETEADSYTWFSSYGLYDDRKLQRFFEAKFGLMAALAFPDADLERFRPAMDFILWLFTFDDFNDAEGPRENTESTKLAISEVMDVLRNPELARPTLSIATSLQSLFRRMRATSCCGSANRFVDAFDLYTQATLKQNINRSVDNLPTVEEFIQLRRDTSAVKMMFPVLEYTLGLSLPDEVHGDPVIGELLLAGNDLLTWANDVYSFPIEQAREDTHNLVFIVMWNEGLDLEHAIDYVDKLIQKRLQEYIHAKAQLRSFSPEVDAQVEQYVRGVEYGVQGSISWTFMTPRECYMSQLGLCYTHHGS